ncbi:uncharacterized protein LOC110866598 [Helianthus annuus]|uniref:uncharacterized protein LOC110866598 n=1 Tax=Helianthus annuus TaxID=4232 RepID=UPI001653153B|nr:uncharacterized protein LOC110866598 [Helianthus annuus]
MVPSFNRDLKPTFKRSSFAIWENGNLFFGIPDGSKCVEVFVGGLARSVTEDKVHKVFSTCGEIMDIHLIKDQNGSLKGFGFVRFTTKDVGDKALKELNESMLKGKKIVFVSCCCSTRSRALKVGAKPNFVLGGTLHPSVKWAEEDAGVDTQELAKIKIAFIINLPSTADENYLKLLFGPFGKVGCVQGWSHTVSVKTKPFCQFVQIYPIEQWIDCSSFEIDVHIRGWLYPRLRFGSYIKRAEESSIAGLKRGFDALNSYLASHTFLVGDGVTLVEEEEAPKPKLNNPLDLLPPRVVEGATYFIRVPAKIDAHIRGRLYPIMRFGSYIKCAEESSIAGLKRGFDALNSYLASHTFLVGDGVTWVEEEEEAPKPKLKFLGGSFTCDAYYTATSTRLTIQDQKWRRDIFVLYGGNFCMTQLCMI